MLWEPLTKALILSSYSLGQNRSQSKQFLRQQGSLGGAHASLEVEKMPLLKKEEREKNLGFQVDLSSTQSIFAVMRRSHYDCKHATLSSLSDFQAFILHLVESTGISAAVN